MPRQALQAPDGSATQLASTRQPIGNAVRPQSPPQNPKARAAQLRATFIHKIAPYLHGTGKPTTKNRFYRIGIVGKDLLVDAIRHALPGKLVGKRKIKVTALTAKTAANTSSCEFDLIYVARTIQPAKLAAIIKSHERLATVLVCERPGFAKQRGGIQLFVSNNKIRFEVNHEALKNQRVRVSPQFLKLSTQAPTK